MGKKRFDRWVRRFGFGQRDRRRPARRGARARAARREVLGLVDGQPADRPGHLASRRCRWPPPTARSPTAACCARRTSSAPSTARPVAPPKGRRVISAGTSRKLREMLEGVFAPGGTASEVSIPGYELAGKTGTANKIDPQTGEYSKSRYIASFIGFAPALKPRLLVGVVVDEPQRRDLRRPGRRAGVRADRVVRPAVPAHPAGVSRIADRGPSGGYAGAMTLRDVLGAPAADAPPVAGHRRWPTTTAPSRPGTLFFCVPGLHARRPRLRARRGRARRGRARRRAPARPRRARGAGADDVRARDGARRRAPARRPDGDAARGRHHRHERQDDDARSSLRALLEAAGRRDRPARHGDRDRRRRASADGRAHDARGDRPAAHVRARCSTRGDEAVRDGGLLARARAAPRRRDPLGRRRSSRT